MSTTLGTQIRNYCAYQERSHHEVRYKLVALGARGLELEQIMTQLIEENYLNEERFALQYAGGKHRVLGWGKQKIMQGLLAKKVSSYCIKKALATIPDTDYMDACIAHGKKKWNSIASKSNSLVAQQKVFNHLRQKGYDTALISKCIQEICK